METKLQALRDAVKRYDPNQPRVPAGNPEGGQWTDGGGGTGGRLPSGPGTLLDVDDSPSERVRLAANKPRNQRRDFPRIPRRRPRTEKERNRALRNLTKLVDQLIQEDEVFRSIEVILDVLDVGDWVLREYREVLQTHINPTKTLEELHEDVFKTIPGTQVHHIVEQGSAYQDGFPRSAIDASDNLVRIPIVRHEEITGWFNTRNPRFGGRKPREYLRGRTWEERRKLGIEALMKFEVLKR
ncbi:hypothetical protein AUC71_14695 [Methyloceanibacter marginalis]|uniref:Uncharacterized protein n=1 Tax=Methyloceanibacter marginalis TaxID=1774971 RepID=A0A1E3W9P1_9HYPH|nr:hypothetical protein [Methyloceanibacter marginalis]ODS02534.1 hypothetical protein AUC71_14695 [Methyloceanibacter marginalis]